MEEARRKLREERGTLDADKRRERRKEEEALRREMVFKDQRAAEGKFPCTKPGCFEVFKREKDMKRHKRAADDHEYCMKHNLDFETYDDFVDHKAMSTEHCSCKFCGMDFKSKEGRAVHIQRQHPVDQRIECIGCKDSFARASGLMYHLEHGLCPVISERQFISYLQHKKLTTEFLENPELITKVQAKDFMQAAVDMDEAGGVNVLDDSTALGLQAPIVLLKASGGKGKAEERWPALQISKEHDEAIVERLASVDINDGLRMKGKVKEKSAHDAWEMDMAAKPFSEYIAPTDAIEGNSPEDQGTEKSAWDIGNTSASKLFSGAGPTPMFTDWEAALEKQQKHVSTNNVLNPAFWDPLHKDHDPERFFNPVLEKYLCPFPTCQETLPIASTLRHHIFEDHRETKRQCPCCLRKFQSNTALLAHVESSASGSRCKISRTKHYGQFIDLYSGGFLGASTAPRDDVRFLERFKMDRKGNKVIEAGDEQDEVAKGERAVPLLYTKYTATQPPGWEDMAKDDEVAGRTTVTVGHKW